jgi:hypothetical protein
MKKVDFSDAGLELEVTDSQTVSNYSSKSSGSYNGFFSFVKGREEILQISNR